MEIRMIQNIETEFVSVRCVRFQNFTQVFFVVDFKVLYIRLVSFPFFHNLSETGDTFAKQHFSCRSILKNAMVEFRWIQFLRETLKNGSQVIFGMEV